MPIDTSSDEWNSGSLTDTVRVEVENFLRKEPEKAYSLQEICEYIVENRSGNLPQADLGVDDDLTVAWISQALQQLEYFQRLDSKTIETDEGTKLYFTLSEGTGVTPTVEVQHEIPRRFSDIEEDTEDLNETVEELENRFNNLSYQVREKFDIWV